MANNMSSRLENANPEVFSKLKERTVLAEELDDSVVDEIDRREIFDILFEHYLTTNTRRNTGSGWSSICYCSQCYDYLI